MVGATVVVVIRSGLVGALVAVSAATAICGDAARWTYPTSMPRWPLRGDQAADNPATIFLMRTVTPSPDRRRAATALVCRSGFSVI